MRYLIIIVLVLLALNVNAAGIYKCTTSDGAVTYDSNPCDASTQKIIQHDGTTSLSRGTNIPARSGRVTINSQADFDHYAKSLNLRSMSEVLSGVTKTEFHGLNVAQLLQSKRLNYDNYLDSSEGTKFLLYLDGSYKLFAAKNSVSVQGRGSHPFLDLSNEEVVARMASLGFGAPQMDDIDYIWKWVSDNAQCSFRYRRSPFSPEKLYAYTCEHS